MFEQHAPDGAHGSVSQTEPWPMNVLPPPQVAGTAMVQLPVEFEQQAPGCGQGLGEQEAKAVNVLPDPPGQTAALVTEHAPIELSQQEPLQGIGEQAEPMPWKTPEQVVEPLIVQAEAPQHAPPQGLGEQVEKSP